MTGQDEGEMEQSAQPRVSKREFLSAVAKRSGFPVKTVTAVYKAILAELMEVVSRGDRLMLTGFGRFYKQKHKGHKVQFADTEGETEIDDYSVLKFSANRDTNRTLDSPD